MYKEAINFLSMDAFQKKKKKKKNCKQGRKLFHSDQAYFEILNPCSTDTGTFRLIGYHGPILMLLINRTHRSDIEESNDTLFSFNIARIMCCLQLHYGAKSKQRIRILSLYHNVLFLKELVNILNIHIVFFFFFFFIIH